MGFVFLNAIVVYFRSFPLFLKPITQWQGRQKLTQFAFLSYYSTSASVNACRGLRLFLNWGTSWFVPKRHSARPHVSRPRLPVSSLFFPPKFSGAWERGRMYFGEQCTLYSNMLKQFKTEKATTGRFSLSMVSFCRNFLALYIWWRLRLHLHLCRKRRNIVSVNFQGFRYKSRTGSHSVVLEHPGTSWFLLCFRKRVLILNLVFLAHLHHVERIWNQVSIRKRKQRFPSTLVKVKSAYVPIVAHQAGGYPGFLSMKRD